MNLWQNGKVAMEGAVGGGVFHDPHTYKGFDIAVQEVQPDHVHLFIRAHPKFAPSTITKVLKGITAKKLFEEFPELRSKLWNGHLWNPSYYIGTCGDCSKEVVTKYIETQKER